MTIYLQNEKHGSIRRALFGIRCPLNGKKVPSTYKPLCRNTGTAECHNGMYARMDIDWGYGSIISATEKTICSRNEEDASMRLGLSGRVRAS